MVKQKGRTPWQKQHKYKAVRTVVDGESFPSKLEASMFMWLKMRQRAGEIKNLTRKATVHLGNLNVTYKADAMYFDNATGETVWCEAKGMETERWRLIKKLWRAVGPGKLEVYKAKGKRLHITEAIVPTINISEEQALQNELESMRSLLSRLHKALLTQNESSMIELTKEIEETIWIKKQD